MIFVTVGTHEQQFDRLVKAMDNLRGDGSLEEEVVIQTGYSTYEPKHCKWNSFYPYQEMVRLVARARIVVTHGGPSSFIMPLQIGKVPIIVPRQKDFEEHVNNHQVYFTHKIVERMGMIILVNDIAELGNTIKNYDEIVKRIDNNRFSNNANFNFDLMNIVNEIFDKRKVQ